MDRLASWQQSLWPWIHPCLTPVYPLDFSIMWTNKYHVMFKFQKKKNAGWAQHHINLVKGRWDIHLIIFLQTQGLGLWVKWWQKCGQDVGIQPALTSLLKCTDQFDGTSAPSPGSLNSPWILLTEEPLFDQPGAENTIGWASLFPKHKLLGGIFTQTVSSEKNPCSATQEEHKSKKRQINATLVLCLQ